MKLGKITSLLSKPEQAQQKSVEREKLEAQTAQRSGGSEAVKLSSSLGAKEASPAERQEKVDQIKAQVDSGDYKVNSEEVAKVLIRDLL